MNASAKFMKFICAVVALLALSCPAYATQDMGESWTTATFSTPQGSSIVVRKKNDRADEVVVDFHGRRFVLPADEIKKLPPLRYDSVVIAYGAGQRDSGITIHFEMERDWKHPEFRRHVMFLFFKDGKFADLSFYSSQPASRE